jgi:feruloyl esterase
LIIYHGASDPAIPAARSVLFYDDLTTLLHGSAKAQANVRLFLVTGMQHCSGGIGPDQFDTLSAIEAWVEHGTPPQAIPASTKPDSPAPHSLPLWPYPRTSPLQRQQSSDRRCELGLQRRITVTPECGP